MLSIYIDGACEPFNPGGTASYGLVVKAQTGLVLHGEAKIVGSGSGISNNVAEYSALIASIEWHMENCSTETVCIMSDSLMLVNQMNGIWQARRGLYLPYLLKALKLIEEHKLEGRYSFKWIPREQNWEADKLSKDILKARGIRVRGE